MTIIFLLFFIQRINANLSGFFIRVRVYGYKFYINLFCSQRYEIKLPLKCAKKPLFIYIFTYNMSKIKYEYKISSNVL